MDDVIAKEKPINQEILEDILKILKNDREEGSEEREEGRWTLFTSLI